MSRRRTSVKGVDECEDLLQYLRLVRPEHVVIRVRDANHARAGRSALEGVDLRHHTREVRGIRFRQRDGILEQRLRWFTRGREDCEHGPTNRGELLLARKERVGNVISREWRRRYIPVWPLCEILRPQAEVALHEWKARCEQVVDDTLQRART